MLHVLSPPVFCQCRQWQHSEVHTGGTVNTGLEFTQTTGKYIIYLIRIGNGGGRMWVSVCCETRGYKSLEEVWSHFFFEVVE